MLFCNQNVNGNKKIHLGLFVNTELSCIFSLALQFKGADHRVVKDIPKLRPTITGPTKI